MDIHATLKTTFGFGRFLPGQEEVISRILDGRSTLAVFPTGQGKSLCYQLSALHLPGLTLVVSPLMALMKDQVDFLLTRRIAAARLDSSLSREEFAGVNADLGHNRVKLLYVAPERFGNERFLALLKRLPISLLVIDEAHCISEWGHNFRPDYLKLATVGRDLKVPVTLALTATATPQVAVDIRAAFAIRPEDFIHTGFYRPNLTLRFSPSPDPLAVLVDRLSTRPPGAVIVYVTLQATAEQVAAALTGQGHEARAYHAGMPDEERQAVQEWFMASPQAVVVATIAFGMGIDKADIRYVFHYNLPKSLENYAQEIGRAGRDGKQAVCEMLGGAQDLRVLENFIYGDTPEPAAVNSLLNAILGEAERFSLSVYETSLGYDIRPLVVNTLLTYLELEGIIESTGPFFTSYKFIPARPSAEILARFDPERAAFLRGLFSLARKARTWFTLDVNEAMEKLTTTRERVVAALNYLEEQGDLELQVAGARRGFKIVSRPGPEEAAALAARLQERFLLREKNDIERLSQVVSLIRHPGCKTRHLLAYFGEERSDNCGHCEYCLTGAADDPAWAATLPPERAAVISAEMQKRLRAILAEQHEALNTPRRQARFFCGIRSPAAGRTRLYGHAAFGLLQHLSFPEVLAWLKHPELTSPQR
ncbi:MAG: helicase [Deltaproteobacteria bacterium RIFOXYD12_FULL_57_12]|nr:MAG: helicase [Deltaproteobacteria bacterium RIFOXYD12_FULL_57_12]